MSLTAPVLPRPAGAVWCAPVHVRTLSERPSCCPVLPCALPFGSTAGSTSKPSHGEKGLGGGGRFRPLRFIAVPATGSPHYEPGSSIAVPCRSGALTVTRSRQSGRGAQAMNRRRIVPFMQPQTVRPPALCRDAVSVASSLRRRRLDPHRRPRFPKPGARRDSRASSPARVAFQALKSSRGAHR